MKNKQREWHRSTKPFNFFAVCHQRLHWLLCTILSLVHTASDWEGGKGGDFSLPPPLFSAISKADQWQTAVRSLCWLAGGEKIRKIDEGWSLLHCVLSLHCVPHTHTPHSLSLRGTHNISCERRKEIFYRFVNFFVFFRGTLSTLSLEEKSWRLCPIVHGHRRRFASRFWADFLEAQVFFCDRVYVCAQYSECCCYIATAASQNGVCINNQTNVLHTCNDLASGLLYDKRW
jgi:hypothetical protein